MRLLLILLSAISAFGQAGHFLTTGTMTTLRFGESATLLPDGRILFAGGRPAAYGSATKLASAELYDPITETFSATGSMSHGRGSISAVLLRDGRVLVMEDGDPELYDPVTEKFIPAAFDDASHPGDMSKGDYFVVGNSVRHFDPVANILSYIGNVEPYGGAVMLPDRRVVVAGPMAVSVYAITDGLLRPVKQYPIGSEWYFRNATLLANGNVLISGGSLGFDLPDTNEALIFDARKGDLLSAGMMLLTQDGGATTLLPDGKVLLSGAYGQDGYDTGVMPGPELYDAVTGQFSSAGEINLYGGSATRLLDGRVLIAPVGETRFTPMLYLPELHATDAAGWGDKLATGALASLFGSELAKVIEAADPRALPTNLGGVSLRIRDGAGTERLARLLYVSPAQINFEVPAGVQPGAVTITVERSGGDSLSTAGWVNAVSPGLFAFAASTIAAASALRVEPDGKTTALPFKDTIVLDDRPVYLTFWGIGIRNRSSVANVICDIGGIQIPVDYAGPEGSGIPGLDQINVRLPNSLRGRGIMDARVSVDGASSNIVTVDIR